MNSIARLKCYSLVQLFTNFKCSDIVRQEVHGVRPNPNMVKLGSLEVDSLYTRHTTFEDLRGPNRDEWIQTLQPVFLFYDSDKPGLKVITDSLLNLAF